MEELNQESSNQRMSLPSLPEHKLLEMEKLPALPKPHGQIRLSEEECARMTAEAAYFHAQRREFQPGHELDDWLAAQKEIEALAVALT